MSTAAELDPILDRLEVFGVRLGLETTHRLLGALEDPQQESTCVLVAGTNGKGSTAALLAGMAIAAGYRTGLYTSPHLESVEERLRIDGRAISTSRLAATLTAIVETAETRLGYLPTYFEALTAAAFKWFAEESVDVAILEVGLGGRLDATNGAEPVLSLITEIGLEHQRYLGGTLASIGREKAGILRTGKPAIAWVERPEARQAIQEVADEVGCRLTWGSDLAVIEGRQDLGWCGQRFDLHTPGGKNEISLQLVGEHQIANLALAVLAAESLADAGLVRLDATAIAKGAASTRWPGRLEWVEPPGTRPVLLDVAHNPDGAQTLERSLERMSGTFVLLFGALEDKQVEGLLPGLVQRAARVILTSPASDRALAPESLAAMVPAEKLVVEPNRQAALSRALEGDGDFAVVCGSVYLVGDVRIDLRHRFGVPLPATDCLFIG